jgi:hypothetical protein
MSPNGLGTIYVKDYKDITITGGKLKTIYIENMKTLHLSGCLTVKCNTKLNNLTVSGNTILNGDTLLDNLIVSGDTLLNNLTVTGTTILNDVTCNQLNYTTLNPPIQGGFTGTATSDIIMGEYSIIGSTYNDNNSILNIGSTISMNGNESNANIIGVNNIITNSISTNINNVKILNGPGNDNDIIVTTGLNLYDNNITCNQLNANGLIMLSSGLGMNGSATPIGIVNDLGTTLTTGDILITDFRFGFLTVQLSTQTLISGSHYYFGISSSFLNERSLIIANSNDATIRVNPGAPQNNTIRIQITPSDTISMNSSFNINFFIIS